LNNQKFIKTAFTNLYLYNFSYHFLEKLIGLTETFPNVDKGEKKIEMLFHK